MIITRTRTYHFGDDSDVSDLLILLAFILIMVAMSNDSNSKHHKKPAQVSRTVQQEVKQ